MYGNRKMYGGRHMYGHYSMRGGATDELAVATSEQSNDVNGGLTTKEVLVPVGAAAITGLATRNVGAAGLVGLGTLAGMKIFNVRGGSDNDSVNSFDSYDSIDLYGGRKSKRRSKGRKMSRKTSKRWIQNVTKSKKLKTGSFTRQAQAAGMSTKAFMRRVLANPGKYSVTTRRRAQFLKNIQKSK